MDVSSTDHAQRALPKTLTGIQGLDEITDGGLPRGRPTLVCGSAGCGKTMLAMEVLIRGATQFNENGVLMAFEESAAELTQNVRSLGFDVDDLVAQGKMVIDFVKVDPGEFEEAGDYDLEGIFVRLGHAIDKVGAKRVVLDTLEALFGGFTNQSKLRSELRRLFRWLKDKGVTAIITGERGDSSLTRQGLEEYVSDCVILLDHRIIDQVSTRRLRIVKYRGTTHGTNEYPFLIDADGISVLPITSIGLDHAVSNERVSSGVERLDAMLSGKGYLRGSTILVSGTAGCGKSSTAAHFVSAACKRGEKCLYFAFEESPGQIIRNMRSIGLDLQPWVDAGLLKFHAVRAATHGLEMHLATFHKLIRQFAPEIVVLDPVDGLIQAGDSATAAAMLTRLIDHLKSQKVTAFLTSLTSAAQARESTRAEMSSLVDTWLFLRDIELGGERNRALYVLKSRGMHHSNQIREFLLTDRGIELQDVYLGSEGVLTGSMRLAKEANDHAEALVQTQMIEARERELERKREALEAKIAALRTEFAAEQQTAVWLLEQQRARQLTVQHDRAQMGLSRQSDGNT